MAYCYKLYDVVRIDHFRGFDEYFSIPYGDKTAMNGHWEKGPGMDLFRTLEWRLGKKDVIAEDLGLMTPSVEQLVKDSGYPNMKVLEFAFEPDEDTGYLPHSYPKNCVVYTGTHDNDTIVSWYEELTPEQKEWLLEYVNDGKPLTRPINWEMIRLAMMSSANIAITPIQDYLGLDTSARMNHPSTLGSNWKWRMTGTELTEELVKEIRRLTRISFRMEHIVNLERAAKAEAKKKLEE